MKHDPAPSRKSGKASEPGSETPSSGDEAEDRARPGLAQTGHASRTIATPEEAAVSAAVVPAVVAPALDPKTTEEEPYAKDAYVVSLPGGGFEGPLDLLLQIIQKHELDILDLPISFITSKYLEYLSVMKELSIDVASEYLVMAATLTHIKSKMLLPEPPKDQEVGEDEEELDPRAELVKRLLEYQKYKSAAEQLGQRDTLGNSVFPRGSEEPVPDGPAPFAATNVVSLLEAFSKVLARTKTKLEHEIVFDRISISDRITELVDVMMERKSVAFEDLFTGDKHPSRFDVVITFLAVLEMCRLRMMRVFQTDPLAPIHVELLVVEQDDTPLKLRSVAPDARTSERAPSQAQAQAEDDDSLEAEAEEEAEAALPEGAADEAPSVELVVEADPPAEAPAVEPETPAEAPAVEPEPPEEAPAESPVVEPSEAPLPAPPETPALEPEPLEAPVEAPEPPAEAPAVEPEPPADVPLERPIVEPEPAPPDAPSEVPVVEPVEEPVEEPAVEPEPPAVEAPAVEPEPPPEAPIEEAEPPEHAPGEDEPSAMKDSERDEGDEA